MNIDLKKPGYGGKKTVAISLASSILLAGFPFFGLDIAKIEAGKLASAPGNGGLVLLESNTLMPMSNPSDFKIKSSIKKKMDVVITAYSSSVWETDDTPFITASGAGVKDGIIASNSLPFGTKIRIPKLYGNKIFTVEDRMHWRVGSYQVDIWFPSYQEAKNFGVERTYIEVLES